MGVQFFLLGHAAAPDRSGPSARGGMVRGKRCCMLSPLPAPVKAGAGGEKAKPGGESGLAAQGKISTDQGAGALPGGFVGAWRGPFWS